MDLIATVAIRIRPIGRAGVVADTIVKTSITPSSTRLATIRITALTGKANPASTLSPSREYRYHLGIRIIAVPHPSRITSLTPCSAFLSATLTHVTLDPVISVREPPLI